MLILTKPDFARVTFKPTFGSVLSIPSVAYVSGDWPVLDAVTYEQSVRLPEPGGPGGPGGPWVPLYPGGPMRSGALLALVTWNVKISCLYGCVELGAELQSRLRTTEATACET